MTIVVEKRTATGKKNRSLRRQGIVPGGISHADGKTSLIQVNESMLVPLTRITGADIFEVELDGKKVPVVLTELVVNPLTNRIEAFSVTELTAKSHVTVRVPVEIVGISPAVKNNLGTMVVNLPELKLTVNSSNIIPKISVDVSTLEETGSRILVSQIEGITDMKLASEKDRSLTVVTIRPLRDIDAEKRQMEADQAAAAAASAETPAEGTEAPAEGAEGTTEATEGEAAETKAE